MNNFVTEATKYLKQAFGKDAEFRDGQLDAILEVLRGKRVLVVQKTGWGKSIIYFLSTKILRATGRGLTIIISPLLALMNNQLDSANKLLLVSRTINSNNPDEWNEIIDEIAADKIDILFISPERLVNDDFQRKVLNKITKSIGMLVVDEAHCISDWGHDFRPDYRRIKNIVKFLPSNVPLLATTATANNRVVEDVTNQLGNNILVQRGPLVRESLCIQVIHLNRKEERLAWLVENINKMSGTGIVYCLTKNDCNIVNKWLNQNGISSRAYYSGLKSENDNGQNERLIIEDMFMKNKIKVIVASTALGMGIDKPDIGFVIHFQKPGNVVSYYQQIGRAGRALDRAYAILLAGSEDDDITEYFINTAFPTYKEMDGIVRLLENNNGMTRGEIMNQVDIAKGRLENSLKFLLVNGDIYKEKIKGQVLYFKSISPWKPDMEYSERITNIRKHELKRMNDFINTKECYMKFVANELNDTTAHDCGKCSNCVGYPIFPEMPMLENVLKATKFLKTDFYTILPRKKWPMGVTIKNKNKIPESYICQNGLALSSYGDAGWGRIVKQNKYVDKYFSDDLVDASAEVLKSIIDDNDIVWVTSIPSFRHPELVGSFAKRLANNLKLPYYESIIKTKNVKQQKELHNSNMQFKNAWESFEVNEVKSGNVLLVDDMVDSRWTFTVCGYKLIEKGSGKVYPFALSNTAGSGGDD